LEVASNKTLWPIHGEGGKSPRYCDRSLISRFAQVPVCRRAQRKKENIGNTEGTEAPKHRAMPQVGDVCPFKAERRPPRKKGKKIHNTPEK